MVKAMLKWVLSKLGITRLKGYTLVGHKYKPMLRLLDELGGRGIDIASLDALEVFGNEGLDHTTTYADRVRNLEVWEIEENLRSCLSENLPNASIRITDSYEEVTQTAKRFDLVVIDNPIGPYGIHCDHFGLFPDKVFRIARERCILVLDVIPTIDRVTLTYFPELKEEGYLDRRKQFYGADDVMHIPINRMASVYRDFAEQNGFRLAWWFHIKRSDAGVHYLVLGIERSFAVKNPAVQTPSM
jgi:hypothetical protein